MEPIEFKLNIDDGNLNQTFNQLLNQTDDLQDNLDKVGQEGTQAINSLGNSLQRNLKTADAFKNQIDQNGKSIDRLRELILFKQNALLRLEKQYASFGKKSSDEAKKVKRAMDTLRFSIKEARLETTALRNENKAANSALANLGNQSAAASEKIKLTRFEAQNLRFQLTDFAVQVGSGQGIFRPLIQQGPQAVEALGGPRRALQFFSQQAKSAFTTITTLRGAVTLLSTAFIGLIGIAIIAFLSRSQKALDALADTGNFALGVFSQLADNLFALGETFVDFVRGESTLRDLGNAALNLGDGLKEAGDQARAFGQALRQLERDEKDLQVLSAQRQSNLIRLKAIADDETKSLSERNKARREAANIERDGLEETLRIARERQAIADREAAKRRESLTLANGEVLATEVQREAAIAVAEAQADLTQQIFDQEKAERSARAARREAFKERQQALQDLQDKAQEVRDKIAELEAKELSGIDKIRAERALSIEEIDRQENELRALYESRGQRFDLEEEFASLRTRVNRKASQDIRAILAQEQRAREEQARSISEFEEEQAAERLENELDLLDHREEILLGQLELRERRRGQTEEDFTREIERRKLQIQIAALRQREQILLQQFGEGSPEVELARQQIALLEQEYSEVANITVAPFSALRQKILDSLNITESEAGELLAGAGNAIASIGELITAGLEAQIAQQDAIIDRTKQNIDDIQADLDKALEDQAAGYANDAALLQEKLQTEQNALATAEEERAKLQERATKRQVRQNQIQAASEYALLVVRLLSIEGAKAGVVGIGIALGGIALVAKIIAEQKRLAAELVAPQGFKDGVDFLEGPGTGRSDSIPANLSRGERVLDAANNATIGGRSLTNDELVRYVKMGQSLEAEIGSFAAPLKAGLQVQQRAQDAVNALQLQAMEKAYRETSNEATGKIVQAIKEQPIVIPVGNTTRVKEGPNKWKVYTSADK